LNSIFACLSLQLDGNVQFLSVIALLSNVSAVAGFPVPSAKGEDLAYAILDAAINVIANTTTAIQPTAKPIWFFVVILTSFGGNIILLYSKIL
jgi:hypothetical protein